MQETIQDRVRLCLEMSGLSAQRASLDAGLSKDAVRKLLANTEQAPNTKTLKGLARVFGVTEQWLLHGDEQPETPPILSQSQSQGIPFPVAAPNTSFDVPLRGTAAGSFIPGAFQMWAADIDTVRRPPGLPYTAGLYALYVEGESMVPEFRPGQLIFVAPYRKGITKDTAVIVQCRDGEEGQTNAIIGLFDKWDGDHLLIRKHNPASTVRLKRDIVLAVHRVLTTNELFGA